MNHQVNRLLRLRAVIAPALRLAEDMGAITGVDETLGVLAALMRGPPRLILKWAPSMRRRRAS